MKELENLLTSLVQRGWKPWGLEWAKCLGVYGRTIYFYNQEIGQHVKISFRMRELISIDSWLWQFCMENGLLNSPDQYPHKDYRAKNPRPYWEMSLGRDCYYKTEVYQYRLLESSLILEEDLWKFLLDNIVIEWNQISNAETK